MGAVSLTQGPSLCPPELSLRTTPSCLGERLPLPGCHEKRHNSPCLCAERQAPQHFSKGFSTNHLGKQPQEEMVLTLRTLQGLEGDLCSLSLALSWVPSCSLSSRKPHLPPSLTPEDRCYQSLTRSVV